MKAKGNRKNISVTQDIGENRIALRSHSAIDMVPCRDIVRCEAARSSTIFYLISGKRIVVSKSMSFFEEKLLEWNFVRVHKSYIVNLQHIEKYIIGKVCKVILTDKSEVPVAIRRKNSFVTRVNFPVVDTKRMAV